MAAAAILFLASNAGWYLVVSDGKSGEELASYPLEPGEQFAVGFIHSVNLRPLIDVYEVSEDGRMYAEETIYYQFGAGVQTEVGEGETMTLGEDGGSHQSIEDMGVLRTIPNMTVIMPADYNAARKLVRQAAETYGPMYLRFTRDAVPQIYDEDVEFTIGKAHQIQDGKDVAIIANGDTVCLAIEAAKVLAGKGISARVLDMHTIKPLDVEAVTAAINDIGKVITVEDHNIINGLGSAVCEVAAEMGKGLVKRVGIRDQFGQSAPYERLLAMNGVTVEDIVAIAESMNA